MVSMNVQTPLKLVEPSKSNAPDGASAIHATTQAREPHSAYT